MARCEMSFARTLSPDLLTLVVRGKIRKMSRRLKLLFVQLPLLDNDVKGPRENLPMAAFYLHYALERSSEARYWRMSTLAPQPLGDAALLKLINRHDPDVLALTLHLWNIERSLHLAKITKRRRPGLRVVVGGPEVARDHPFLFECDAVDVAVSGEGEPVFPEVLRGLRTGCPPNFSNVAWRSKRSFRWGTLPPPPFRLAEHLPPAEHSGWKPDANGIAYLETTRGCPLRCAFCCYGQRRLRVTALPTEQVLKRLPILVQRGARVIRFVDPTFNAHPEFSTLIREIAQFNRAKRVEFFAEIRGDTITSQQAHMLAQANFRELEIGMQSRNAHTLRAVRRPLLLEKLDRGIRRLARAGIRVTVDLMYGLPQQKTGELQRMISWAARQRRVRVQFMHTLALPGTELRARRHEWNLQVENLPPYAVRATADLSNKLLCAADQKVAQRMQVLWDCPTGVFIGRHLPDLFDEQISLRVPDDLTQSRFELPGRADRRAILFHGRDLFAHRRLLTETMAMAIEQEPHILWQFVVVPDWEEPLDLLEAMIRTIQRAPLHVLDRFIALHSPGRMASRRVFIRLKAKKRYSRDWQDAIASLLTQFFY